MKKDYSKISYEPIAGEFFKNQQVYRNKKTHTPYSFYGKHPVRLLKAVCGVCRKPIWKSYNRKGSTSVCEGSYCITEINRQTHLTLSDGDTFVSCGYRYTVADNHFPELKRKRYIQEHRYVMEIHLGRPLVPKIEVIHHINFDKLDNSIVNLFLCSPSGHIKAERSLHTVANELLSKGIIQFDHASGTYQINSPVLIATKGNILHDPSGKSCVDASASLYSIKM